MIAHWDDAGSGRAEAGHIGGVWTGLGEAAGTRTVGVNRIQVDPGKWSTPFHRQTAEEEIFFVLAGSGVCLLDGSAFEVRPGDCIVHRVREAHTLRAGDEGLDVLAFGTRGGTEVGHLPRAGVGWIGSPCCVSRQVTVVTGYSIPKNLTIRVSDVDCQTVPDPMPRHLTTVSRM